MITIKVVAIVTMRPYVGGNKVQYIEIEDQANVMDLIEKLIGLYGDALRDVLLTKEMELNYGIALLLNGRNIMALDGFKMQLSEGDELLILPPLGGG